MRCRRRTPVIPERPWPWRRWPTACGSSSCASTRRTPCGRIATVSCFRSATPPCCSIRCCILPEVQAVNKDYETLGDPSVPLDAIKSFRQLDSRCPGHPEYRWTSGVETTTGPLGQGRSDQRRHGDRAGSGWRRTTTSPASRISRLQRLRALRRWLHDGRDLRRSRFARRTSAACRISAGSTTTTTSPSKATLARAFTEDVATRFIGYGWNVTRVGDANDLRDAARAFRTFSKHQRPADADHRRQPHRLRRAEQAGYQRRPRRAAGRRGSPSRQTQLRLARRREVLCAGRRLRALPQGIGKRGKDLRDAWFARIAEYRKQYPDLPTSCIACSTANFRRAGTSDIPEFPADPKGLATRESSAKVLNAVAKNIPWLIGGSADLAPSTKTRLTFDGAGDFSAENYAGAQLPFRNPRARHGARS